MKAGISIRRRNRRLSLVRITTTANILLILGLVFSLCTWRTDAFGTTLSSHQIRSSVPIPISSRLSVKSRGKQFPSPPSTTSTTSWRHTECRAKNDVQQGDEAENNNFLQCGVRSCRRFALKTKIWMQRVLTWQKSKGRNLLVAAAFSLSILFCSQQQLSNYNSGSGNVPQSQNEINLVQKSSSSTSIVRGGDTARSTASPSRGFMDKQQEAVQEAVYTAAGSTGRTLKDALVDLSDYMKGPKSDTILLLMATALITPLCQRLGTSPILGFLASGMLLGPNGWGLISGIHTTETLAELGIVFFLFEMGIELSVDRLLSMRRDVFGLGLSQFLGTALAIAAAGSFFGLPANALVVLGGGLALSSSAFVLQLLKDKNQLATRFGKASFGVLLFQDLAVVPLLVVTPILAGGGGGLASALGSAVLKAGMALGSITLAGRYLLNPLFKLVAQAQSQEAFLGVILLTVLSMSFMTEGLGLSNTLGAFLAGVLLSETKYRYQVEADIAPFRGVLLGLFFVTVGFEIDLHLVASRFPLVSGIVLGIIAIKAIILTGLSLVFGLSLSVSQQTGLILSQGGEFAFVAFGLARSLGILDVSTTKLMLTSVSLTMALTPLLSSLGAKISKQLEEQSDFTHYLGQDRDANEIKESDDFAVVVGYGAVGKVVCDILDAKLIKYVGIDIDPNKAIQARNAGLPVFYGDIGRQEVAEAFNVGKAKAIVVCIADKAETTRAVIALRRWYPDVKIFCRARDRDHAYRLQSTLDVAAMVPILPEDNLLLTLPFGGAVLKALGAPPEEVNAILETKRKEVLGGKGSKEAEEEMALAQLGIEKPVETTPKKSVLSEDDDSEKKGSADKPEEEVAEAERLAVVAEERIEETKEKSPFVAQVIGEALADSVAELDESKKEEEIVVVKAEVISDSDEKIISVSTDDNDVKIADVDVVSVAAPSTTSTGNNTDIVEGEGSSSEDGEE